MFAAAGAALGAAGRRVLAVLPRGTYMRAGPLEAVSAALFAVIAVRAGHAWPLLWLPVPALLTLFAVPLAAVDLKHRRLPDALTLSAAATLGLAVAVIGMTTRNLWLVGSAGLGAIAFFSCHWCVHRVRPGSLGAGDVKLAVGLGGVLGSVGWPAVIVGSVLAGVTTAALAMLGRIAGIRAWRAGVPHGPGLLAGTWLLAVFPGEGLGVGP